MNQLGKDFCEMKDMANNGDFEGGTLYDLGRTSQESENSKRQEDQGQRTSASVQVTTIFVAMVACSRNHDCINAIAALSIRR